MAADAHSAEQKEGLTTAMNALLASNLPELLPAENLGAAKDSLVNAITATYPDATNKLQALSMPWLAIWAKLTHSKITRAIFFIYDFLSLACQQAGAAAFGLALKQFYIIIK
jgi:hypothetical protein